MSLARHLSLCALLICTLINQLAAASGKVQTALPFEATYEATYNGLTVTANRSLKANSDGSFTLNSTLDHWLASLHESSRFQYDQKRRIQPLKYTYERKGFGSKSTQLQFDWAKHTAWFTESGKRRAIDAPGGTLDKLSYQLQLRQDLLNGKPLGRYDVIDGTRLKSYDFSVLGREVLQTPLGKLNTVKIQRVRDNKDRVTLIWMAADWNFLLVKIQQYEEGEQDFAINLQSARVGGRPVTGL